MDFRLFFCFSRQQYFRILVGLTVSFDASFSSAQFDAYFHVEVVAFEG